MRAEIGLSTIEGQKFCPICTEIEKAKGIGRSGGQRPRAPEKVTLDPVQHPLLDLDPLGSL